jgi:hypothetical protein
VQKGTVVKVINPASDICGALLIVTHMEPVTRNVRVTSGEYGDFWLRLGDVEEATSTPWYAGFDVETRVALIKVLSRAYASARKLDEHDWQSGVNTPAIREVANDAFTCWGDLLPTL